MFQAGSDPVRPISLGSALKVTLDNFYDLLKTNVGVATNEMLQLRLSADILDVSDDTIPPSKGGYKWFTYHDLVDRGDRQIEPTPVSPDPQGASINAVKLSDVYGQFLQKLRSFVVRSELSPTDQIAVANINALISQDRIQYEKLAKADRDGWVQHCQNTGGDVSDRNAYVSWSSIWGHLRDIKVTLDDLKAQYFALKTVMDRTYADPTDRAIVDAEFDFNNLSMKASYPNLPDYDYPDGDRFDIIYLINLGTGGTGAFDWRYVINWGLSLGTIRTTPGGHFNTSWNQTEQTSKSIETDWSGSASGSYYFISARASASEHTKIQDDFDKTQVIALSCQACFRINLKYPQWFHPELFKSKYIKANPNMFDEFFGPQGSLLYYPLAIVVIRGFSTTFTSSQNWVYDYERTFKASGGGGFGIGPIRFGASASYNSHVHEHQVDKQNTSLTLGDDPNTIRFVGYVLSKNTVAIETLDKFVAASGLRETKPRRARSSSLGSRKRS